MLTESRAEILSKYLLDDDERAAKLLEMKAEEAVEKINADGYDFTPDELLEFGKQLQTVAVGAGEGELDNNTLGNVTGGISSITVLKAALTVASKLPQIMPKGPISPSPVSPLPGQAGLTW